MPQGLGPGYGRARRACGGNKSQEGQDGALPKEEQEELESLRFQLTLNDMLRYCPPDRRYELVAAAWRLEEPSGHFSRWRNKQRLAVLQPPPLDTCPLWQVVRFLNQTGIPIPGPLTDLYFGTGAGGHEALRADAATYLLTWQCQRFMLCLSHVDGLRTRIQAALGAPMLLAPVRQQARVMRRQSWRLREQLLGNIAYAGDLPPEQRRFVEEGDLAAEVVFVLLMAQNWMEERTRDCERRGNNNSALGWITPRPLEW